MFRSILVPLDQSALAERAIATATEIARASGGTMDFVLAHEPRAVRGSGSLLCDSSLPSERIYLLSRAEEIALASGVPTSAACEFGAPADVICGRAATVGADLIVMTTHGRTGLKRSWLGSVADAVMRNASVPVLMLRPTRGASVGARTPPPTSLFSKILVPLDGSSEAAAILDSAVTLARCSGATLVLLRVVNPVPIFIVDAALPGYPASIEDPDATLELVDDATAELRRLADRLERESVGCVEVQVVVSDYPAASILAVAHNSDADAIAMTTHGRGTSRVVLGSVADKVLRGSHLPLLLYHPRAAVPAPAHSLDDLLDATSVTGQQVAIA